MSPLRVLRGFVFGGLGGFLGWMLVEFLPVPDIPPFFSSPFRPARFEHPDARIPLSSATEQGLLGMALGLAIGAFLGISEGIGEGTTSRFKRAFFSFMALGAVGGFVGMYFGQILFGLLGGKVDIREISGAEFFPQIFARSLAWMLIGLFLGLVLGAPNLSFRRMWNGAVGGAIGGFLGGFVFMVMMFTGLFQGPQGRFIGFTIIGAAIGFFINLIAEAMKRVWVKVLIGRNEGREHVLDTPLAYVGRDELADVPVFLDPMVPKRMASFRMTGGRYALYPESAALPLTVNGQALTPGQVLRDGDAIQFGRVTLGYYEKATATGTQRPVDSVALADFGPPTAPGRVSIPKDRGVCPFCGQPKDPQTGACACSVAPGYAPPADPGYAPPGYPPQGWAPPDPGYAAPPPGYAPAPDPYATSIQDPAYAATIMDPGAMGGYAPADPGAGPRLVATGGPFAGQVFPLYAADMGIGREPTQEVPLNGDATASRRHARLFAGPTGWILRDEGSANGTWVNGARISEQPLYGGETIRIGATELRFEP